MEMHEITEIEIPEDKDTICRFCLNLSNELTFLNDSDGKSLGNILKKLCINIDKAEHLPKGICWECKGILENFLTFVEKIENNEMLLKNVYDEDSVYCTSKVIKDESPELPTENDVHFSDFEENDTAEWVTSPNGSNIVNVEHAYGKQVGFTFDHTPEDNESEEEDVEGKIEIFDDLNSPSPDTFEYTDAKPEIIRIEQDTSQEASTSWNCKNEDTEFGTYKVIKTSPSVVKMNVRNRKKSKQQFTVKRKKKIIPRKVNLKQLEEPEVQFIKQCLFCTRKFNSDGLRILHYVDHVVKATEDMVTHRPFCIYCGLLTGPDEDLNEHISSEHANEDQLHCHKCEIKFTKISELKVHEKNDHLENYEEEDYKVNKCPICDEVYDTIDELIKHSLTHISRRHTCISCKKIYVCDAALNEHLTKHPKYKFRCPICKKLMSGKASLEAHIETHATTKNYSCDVCGKMYKTNQQLHHHRGKHFRPDLICSQCGYSTTTAWDFMIHSRIHSGERPYQCTFKDCRKAYKTNSALSEHVKQHLNLKKFACDVCGYRTSRSNLLTSHKRRHTGDRPYSCNICSKSFYRRWNLTVHMRKPHDVNGTTKLQK